MFIAKKHAQGFSIIELITILIIIGILAASSTRIFLPSKTFQMQASRDQIVAAISAAQQRAMSRKNAIRVTSAANLLDIREDVDGDGDFSPSASVSMGGVTYPLPIPVNQNLSAVTFTFNRLGQTNGASLTLSQSGASVTIEVTDSGYVY